MDQRLFQAFHIGYNYRWHSPNFNQTNPAAHEVVNAWSILRCYDTLLYWCNHGQRRANLRVACWNLSAYWGLSSQGELLDMAERFVKDGALPEKVFMSLLVTFNLWSARFLHFQAFLQDFHTHTHCLAVTVPSPKLYLPRFGKIKIDKGRSNARCICMRLYPACGI